MTRYLYWTLHRRERIAVVRETPTLVVGDGERGPARRPRRECRGRFTTPEACREAQEMLHEVRRRYRARREEISAEKQRMRREELLSLVQITGGPP